MSGKIAVPLSKDERAWLDAMRREGKEHRHLGPFIRSVLQAVIADDKAAEAARK